MHCREITELLSIPTGTIVSKHTMQCNVMSPVIYPSAMGLKYKSSSCLTGGHREGQLQLLSLFYNEQWNVRNNRANKYHGEIKSNQSREL